MARLRELNPPPDFILLDVNLSPLNGYKLIAAIRSDPAVQDKTVLAVTASVMSREIEALRQAGFDGALAKPLDMATFPEILQRLEAGDTIWQTH